MTPATSSGVPNLFIGIFSVSNFLLLGVTIEVSISPGAIALTLILSFARSDAISLVSDFRAALDVA